MEFHFGLWNGVSALFTEGGRQLGEENARPLTLNHHVPAETHACKYPGSRDGRLINMSALRTAMQNFDAALAITEAVRRAYLGLLPTGHQLGIWDLNIIARASIALVAYQQRFARQNPAPKAVSDALASQYQFISGVFMICRHMMENADPTIAANRPMSAEALYAYADDHGIFISFNGMACAGSTKKIHDFLAFCNQGSGDPVNLAEIVSEPDNWLRYALAAIELDCVVEAERASLAGQSASADQFRSFGSYVRELMGEDAASISPNLALEDAALQRQNRICEVLGRPPLDALPSKHIAARLA